MEPPPSTAAFVTGAAAQELRSDGTFSLPDSVVHPQGQLGEEQARQIATNYAITFGRSLAPAWENAHRAPIDYKALRPCGRALYARSAYKPLDKRLSDIAKRTFGPHWIVPMCGSTDVPSVVITFSALATDLLDSRDSTRTAAFSRTDFRSHGLPPDASTQMLFSREGAARRAAVLAGKRIVTVPDLMMSPMPTSPALLHWRVTFEGPVQVRSAAVDSVRPERTLYVGFDRIFATSGLLRATSAQPLGPPPSWPDTGNAGRFTPELMPDAAAHLELVTRVAP